MAKAHADFHLVPLDGMAIGPDVRRKAVNNLQRLCDEGELPAIPGWEGDVFDGYMDILGLNGRVIKVNHGPGMRGR